MGVKKYNFDDQYHLDELKNLFENGCSVMKISVSFTEIDEKRPSFEINGTITKDEMLKMLQERKQALHTISQMDELTGLYNHSYYEKRIATIDRSQVLPVAVINFNINDWKLVNDNFGNEESDRLIEIISNIIKSEAKPYFVCGRVDGDVFGVVIPMALEGEAEEFVRKVKDNANSFDDEILAPSVAAGIVYKTNIEQKIDDLWSDAEYEMFSDKYETKNSQEYKDRLVRKNY